MRGLKHSVIEINDTQNSEIEKILVFLRPGDHKIDVDNTRKDAQEILQKVKIRPQIPKMNFHPKVWLTVASIIIGIISLLIVII